MTRKEQLRNIKRNITEAQKCGWPHCLVQGKIFKRNCRVIKAMGGKCEYSKTLKQTKISW